MNISVTLSLILVLLFISVLFSITLNLKLNMSWKTKFFGCKEYILAFAIILLILHAVTILVIGSLAYHEIKHVKSDVNEVEDIVKNLTANSSEFMNILKQIASNISMISSTDATPTNFVTQPFPSLQQIFDQIIENQELINGTSTKINNLQNITNEVEDAETNLLNKLALLSNLSNDINTEVQLSKQIQNMTLSLMNSFASEAVVINDTINGNNMLINQLISMSNNSMDGLLTILSNIVQLDETMLGNFTDIITFLQSFESQVAIAHSGISGLVNNAFGAVISLDNKLFPTASPVNVFIYSNVSAYLSCSIYNGLYSTILPECVGII